MTELGTERRRDAALDGLCGIAVLAVIADQVGAATGRTGGDDFVAAIVRRLDAGLAVVLVVAGFRLYLPFARSAGDGRRWAEAMRFLRRRLTCLLPPVWVTIAVTFVVTARTESWPDWLRHFTLVQPLSFFYLHGSLAHLWPVSMVAAFVVALPAISAFALGRAPSIRRQLAVITGMVVVTYVFVVAQGELRPRWPALQWLPAHLDWFAAGMLLAVVAAVPDAAGSTGFVRTCAAWAESPWTCWATAATVWLISVTDLGGRGEFTGVTRWEWLVQHATASVAAFFVVVPFALPTADARRLLGAAAPAALGAMAYGVYLWGLPSLLAVQDLFDIRPFGGRFLVSLTLTVATASACAYVSWRLVEGPLLRRWRVAAAQESRDGA